MTELDEEFGPLALDLIDEYGTLVSYIIVGGEAVYNTATGKNQVPETPIPDFKVLPPEDYAGTVIGGSNGLIEQGDKKFTAAALSFPSEPTPEDRLQWRNSWWTIKAVQTVFSGDEPCLYILQGRK